MINKSSNVCIWILEVELAGGRHLSKKAKSPGQLKRCLLKFKYCPQTLVATVFSVDL